MRHIRWKAILATAVAGMLLPHLNAQIGSASAQLMPTPDTTLGEESSTVERIDFATDPDYRGDVIRGGARRGDALFHSFEEFNVDPSRAIYFEDPGVDSILSRVTGRSESQILGLLGVLGDADLFILNPNGIVFGRNAQLDLRGGSFLATTSDVVAFEGGIRFDSSGTSLPTAPLLTVQPSAFLFNSANPTAIANNARILRPTGLDSAPGGGLRVADGERITLLGGNISMDNGGLSALGGRVEVGGLNEPGTVEFNLDGSLTFPSDVVRSDVLIANGSRLVASDFTVSGGSVAVTANTLDITNRSGDSVGTRSGISAGTVGEASFTEEQAGDIMLNASTIRLVGSTLDNLIRGSSGNGGDVLITADELLVSEEGVIQANLLGEGSAGKIKIDASDRVVLDNGFLLSTLGGSDRTVIATGEAGGNIEVTAPTVALRNGSQLQSGTIGQGNAGNVVINASERVTLAGNSAIFSEVRVNAAGNAAVGNGGNIRVTTPFLSLADRSTVSSRATGRGNGGDIQIEAGSLSLAEDSRFLTDSSGRGDAGNVSIETQGRTLFDQSRILSNLNSIPDNTTTVGNTAEARRAGNIQITAGSLELRNDSDFESNTFALGDAGNITIQARNEASLSDRSSLSSRTEGQGNGGDIQIEAGSLSLARRSQLLTRSSGQGSAGNVSIETEGRTVFDRSRIVSDLRQLPNGTAIVGDAANARRAGDIQVTAGSLDLLDDAAFQSTTFGQGDAGSMTIRTRDRTSISDSSTLLSRSRGSGNGGDIQISAGSLSLIRDSRLLTDSSGQGDAGNVSIEAQGRAVFEQSSVISNLSEISDGARADGNTSENRSAGNIQISAESLDLLGGSQLQSITSGPGDAGNVTVRSRDRISIEGGSPDNSAIYSAIFASTQATAEGRGGNVKLSADSVRIADSGFIFTSTFNRFPGGTVNIDANTLEIASGGQVVTRTSASGPAGNIELDIAERTILSGISPVEFSGDRSPASGLLANTIQNSSGSGGTVRLSTPVLQVLDQARIEVDSRGSGTAGDIAIAANTVKLDNGRLTAETTSVNGGNIALNNAELLLLQNGSLISTTAGTDGAGGDGGNIDIAADAIVAAPGENNDIRANAFSGSGGNVQIDSQGLFGIAAQSRDNRLTNDITASSEQGIQGTVDIATPQTDLRSGLAELPDVFADASDQITQTCSGNRDGQNSEFVVSRRGGLPLSPIDALVGNAPLSNWAVLDEPVETRSLETTSSILPEQTLLATEESVVEAQGWIEENGRVKLIATAPASVAQTMTACR